MPQPRPRPKRLPVGNWPPRRRHGSSRRSHLLAQRCNRRSRPAHLREQTPVEQVEPNQVKEPEPPVIAQEEEETIAQQEVALTPEQTFLAGIKQSISSYNSQLHDELIASVKVDFERSFLQVKLEPLWYDLSDVQQDRLADDIWRHAKDMAFAKIELADGDGTILARSPVVGKDMVILQRTKA